MKSSIPATIAAMAKNAPNAIPTITPVERDDEPELGEPVVLLDVVGVS